MDISVISGLSTSLEPRRGALLNTETSGAFGQALKEMLDQEEKKIKVATENDTSMSHNFGKQKLEIETGKNLHLKTDEEILMDLVETIHSKLTLLQNKELELHNRL